MTVTALMLPEDRASSTSPQTIPGVPGRWVPGQAYLPSALGLSDDEARALVRSLGASSPIVLAEIDDQDTVLSPVFHAYPSQVSSEFFDAAAERTADARDETGVAVAAAPAWADEHRRRSTDLTRGVDPDAALLETAAAAERESLKIDELRARAVELGVDPKGLRKDDLLKVIADVETDRIERGDVIAPQAEV